MERITINTYNQMAEAYDAETTDFWQRFPVKIFQEFQATASGPVLDVGSGPGRDAEYLRDAGFDVTCLDASNAMIKMTTGKGFPSVLADFTQMPFADQSFGAIWAYTSLLHVPKNNVHQAFSEINRVLQNNGVLGLGLIEGNEEGYKKSSGMQQDRYFSYYQKPELEELLVAHGFQPFYFETFKPGSKNYLHFLARKST